MNKLLNFVCYFADKLPYSIRILLESAIRNCDNFQVSKEDVEKIIDWEKTSPKQVEIPFKPARVLLQVPFGVYLKNAQNEPCLICFHALNHFFTFCDMAGLYWSPSCC